MSRYDTMEWRSGGTGLTRGDRRVCRYAVYVPDPLAGRSFTFDGDVAADIADAEAAVIRLNNEASTLANTEAIARLLLRAEAVASSRIEGLQIGARRLLRAEAARAFEGRDGADVTAEEILGNIDAMATALEYASSADPVTVDTILGIHQRLMAGTRLDEHAGRLREVQNWIGGSGYNPCSAAFVPPPPGAVPELVADLAEFCNDDSLPAVAQAAIAHAQFETIHPFVDGNGRTGRALIHLVLRRRGLAPRVVPPVSLVLATRTADYIAGLTAFRHEGDPSSAEAMAGVNTWVARFAAACTWSVQHSDEFERRIEALKAGWRERVGSVRRRSTVELLIETVPGHPVLTVKGAASLSGRSFRAANNAVSELEQAGVLRQITVGRRNRAFEAADAIEAFIEFEQGGRLDVYTQHIHTRRLPCASNFARSVTA